MPSLGSANFRLRHRLRRDKSSDFTLEKKVLQKYLDTLGISPSGIFLLFRLSKNLEIPQRGYVIQPRVVTLGKNKVPTRAPSFPTANAVGNEGARVRYNLDPRVITLGWIT